MEADMSSVQTTGERVTARPPVRERAGEELPT
jgi:hypothetical protein